MSWGILWTQSRSKARGEEGGILGHWVLFLLVYVNYIFNIQIAMPLIAFEHSRPAALQSNWIIELNERSTILKVCGQKPCTNDRKKRHLSLIKRRVKNETSIEWLDTVKMISSIFRSPSFQYQIGMALLIFRFSLTGYASMLLIVSLDIKK